jgi:hypothetical protein
MVTKICHRKLTKGYVKLTKGYVNVCTLTLGTTNRAGVLFCGCPVIIEGLNCSHFRSMNKRY